MNELIAQLSGRAARDPAAELHAAEAALHGAESRGDQQAVDEGNQAIDDLFTAAREQAREEASQAARAARFSSGVRRPVVRRPSPSAQMNAAILRASGRLW